MKVQLFLRGGASFTITCKKCNAVYDVFGELLSLDFVLLDSPAEEIMYLDASEVVALVKIY